MSWLMLAQRAPNSLELFLHCHFSQLILSWRGEHKGRKSLGAEIVNEGSLSTLRKSPRRKVSRKIDEVMSWGEGHHTNLLTKQMVEKAVQKAMQMVQKAQDEEEKPSVYWTLQRLHRNEGWVLFLWTGKLPCKKANFSSCSHLCLLTSIFYIKISPHFTLCCLVRGYLEASWYSSITQGTDAVPWCLGMCNHPSPLLMLLLSLHREMGQYLPWVLCKHDTINALQKCVCNKDFIFISIMFSFLETCYWS